MAASTEKQLSQGVYAALQAASCPLVEGVYLREADSMQELLCTPSQYRTDILAWICGSFNPDLMHLKMPSLKPKDPNALTKEMAMVGYQLMLCKADDFALIGGSANPLRQLQFLEQLLDMMTSSGDGAEGAADGEALLGDLYATETRALLTHTLNPAVDPWPAHIKALRKGHKSSFCKQSQEEAANVEALLQSTQTALEQLQSECEFLHSEAQSPDTFSPCGLRVALSDLHQSTAAFSRVYQTDFSEYCNRELPGLSTETVVFQRIHQLLLAFQTELEMLDEVSEASVSVANNVSQLQTRPLYWSRGEKHTLPDRLEELTSRYRDFLSLLHT